MERIFTALLLLASAAVVLGQGELVDEDGKLRKCVPSQFRVVDEALGLPTGWLDWQAFNATYLANEALAGGSVVVTAEVSEVPCALRGCCNMLMSFRPNTTDINVFRQVFKREWFSPIYEHLEKIQPEYILDGGGNVGFVSALFAMAYPDAHIITVEPDKANFAMLVLNTHRFPNVHAVNAGLWDKQAHIALMAQEREWGSMFKEVPIAHEGTVYGTTITHLLQRFAFPLLDFAKAQHAMHHKLTTSGWHPPRLLKPKTRQIDIEGAESRVMSPGADLKWLDTTKLISMELHNRMGHYYGLEKRQVSKIVMSTMDRPDWTSFKGNEHIFFQHSSDGVPSLSTSHQHR